MISLVTTAEALSQIAGLMRQRRLDMNMTQVLLAERSNVSLAVLRKFERSGKISLESFMKLAFTLDVMDGVLAGLKNKEEEFSSMDELLKENQNKPRKKASRRAK